MKLDTVSIQRVLDNEVERPVPQWVTAPCLYAPITSPEEAAARANEYFTRCAETGDLPRLTGVALALGMTGPVSLQRFAMRHPEYRWILSRCMLAVAHGYEEAITAGKATTGAIFMLKHLPEFDIEEPPGSAPIQYFAEKREIAIHTHIPGVEREEDRGANLSPREAYIKVIHGHCDSQLDIYEGKLETRSKEAETLAALLAQPIEDAEIVES